MSTQVFFNRLWVPYKDHKIRGHMIAHRTPLSPRTIHNWSKIWQIKIYYTKCNILTIGHMEDHHQYFIDNNPISKIIDVRDLGVTVDHALEFNLHINTIVHRANQRFRSFLSRNPNTLARAFKVYIRPILDYASTAWSPSYIYLINLLENVQRSFTKRISGCSHLSYPERLSLLNIHTLKQRRLFADLIMCYNIIKDNNCIDSSTFFTFSNNKFSRGHPLKLSVPLTRHNTRKYFVANRVIPIWNLCQPKLLWPLPYPFLNASYIVQIYLNI